MPDRKLVPVPYQTLVRIFEKDAFTLARQEGDYKIFTKAGVLRPLVIPAYRAVPVFIIRNLLRTSGMSRERYFELMEECSPPTSRPNTEGGS